MSINNTNPNRQRMINLMYIVFIAMMSLNVSSDVLDGFVKVNKSIDETILSNESHNKSILDIIKKQYDINPNKAKKAYNISLYIKSLSDSLKNYINTLKNEIAIKTDGDIADVKNIIKKENVNATNSILLSAINPKASELKNKIEEYKDKVLDVIGEDAYSKTLDNLLSTRSLGGQSWSKSMFYNMPTVATLTILTKLQNDVSLMETHVLNKLLNDIDNNDYKVNSFNAVVTPKTKMVVLGQNYEANISLSSVDTTQKPKIIVNGHELSDRDNGRYQVPTTKIGTYPVEGYIELLDDNGQHTKYSFKSNYTVVEPLATVSPILMNVVYVGIDNPINITAPGFPTEKIIATIDNGRIVRRGVKWIVQPSKANQDATISISAQTEDNNIISLGKCKLKVRLLPDPSPYIIVQNNGTSKRLKNGRISKNELLSSQGLLAAIDDNIIDIEFEVIGFSILTFDSMGNAIPEISDGHRFSLKQIKQIKNLRRGSIIYITSIKAKSPDGSIREISPMELKIA